MLVPKVIVQSFAIAVLISLLSSTIPVRKAAGMNITDALRHV
jgi:ABC-type lipoprotein release transport system permease subunit